MTCRQWLPPDGKHCGRPARFFACGWRCDQHTPAAQAGRPEPPSTPMETR